ncbi:MULTISPECIES: response regulator [Clostridium]|uniref:response regulator n=1 Tax=Clostridium TaxID=1485 RepID=UPI0021532AF4|nr:response regulator [Clostridium sp. LY3-2]MCR6514520.1 response regulator [Clostridium sp. LY3-2]
MVNVMVVDDEKLEREVLKAILEKNERISKVYEAKNGKEALEINREFNPDIIFMDIKMPGIDGVKALELIKNEYPNKKVVMITAYDDFEFIHKVLVLGGTDYILKPIKPSNIIDIVNNIIDKINTKSVEVLSEEVIVKEDKEDLIKKGKKFIKDNVSKPIKLEDIASFCNLSPSYFSRLFKKETGKTVISYINEEKIEKAKELLKNTYLPIINISLDLGFDDCGYFIRVFKKATGVTPKVFREEK